MLKPSPAGLNGNKFSIMQRIIDGTLKIDSIQEFEDILAFYPEDPFLYRKYADLLLDQKKQDEAFQGYGKASELFIEQGMNLQAVVSKILQWSIRKPSHDQGRVFHALLHEKGSRHTPLQRFWARMRYPEMIAVMLRLVRVHCKAGKKIIQAGDPATEVFFVVSGALSETPSQDCETEAAMNGFETEPRLLGANDIFGDIFPLDRPTQSSTEVRTLTEVELVKIEKSVLAKAALKFPRIKKLLEELYRTGNHHNCDRTWQTVRRALRFGLPTKVEVSSHPSGTDDPAWLQTGIAVDISLGGMCVDLGSDFDTASIGSLKGQPVFLNLDLLNDLAELSVTGTIVWHRDQKNTKGTATYIGIRFDTLNKHDRELLLEYCSGSVGEQNLLWSLWDTMIRTEE